MKITHELISDLLTTALEGGSNYWYLLGSIDHKHFIKGDTLSDNLARSFMADKNYSLNVYDIDTFDVDTDPDLLGNVTYASIENALAVMLDEFPHSLANIIKGDYDADDADVWFQIATMGEVQFG